MRMIGKWVMAPIRATAGRVSLQMTGRALISLKVNDANAMSAPFDPCLPDPRRVLAVSPDRNRGIWDGCLPMRATTRPQSSAGLVVSLRCQVGFPNEEPHLCGP